jgi:ABC-2 type transport system ATP-binding protein
MSDGVLWEGVSASYGERPVLQDVTLRAQPGRILGVIGSNGAGKTTLFRLACGLMRPTAGTVQVGGRHIDAGATAPGIGAMIEEPRFYPWASGRHNLQAMCGGRPDRLARVDALLEEVGLSQEQGAQTVREYSQGMRQRLGIARALLGDPLALILDEPANGLDPRGLRWLAALLARLRDEGRTLIVSSHVLSHLERGADDIAVLADGRILRAGPIGDVVEGGESLEDVYFRLAGA